MTRSVLVGALVVTASCAQLLGFDQDRLASGGSPATNGGSSAVGGAANLGGTSTAHSGSPAGEAGQQTTGGASASAGGASARGGSGGSVSGGASSFGGAGQGGAPKGGSVSDAGGGGDVSSAGAGGEGGNEQPCSATAGPVMVRVGSYCMDQTEVSNLQYHQFVKARVEPATISGCEWKANFMRDPPATERENIPVGNVDWCDAKAYCLWAGKRLCGRSGDGANPPNDDSYLNSPALDEWYRVCSDNGSKKYSYGQSYDASVCNSKTGDMRAVGTTPTCTAYNGKIFDLLGNTWEWVAACETDSQDLPAKIRCRHRGGSHAFDDISCQEAATQARDFRAQDLGFRCCSD